MTRKISIVVYLEPEQHPKLKELAKDLDRPVAEIVREGVELVYAKYKPGISEHTHGIVAGSDGTESDKELLERG